MLLIFKTLFKVIYLDTYNFNIYNSKYSGISLIRSDFNIISGSILLYNDKGIMLFGHHASDGSDNNTITGNLLLGNNACLNVFYSEDNTILGNICIDNIKEITILGYILLGSIGTLFLIAIIIRRKKRQFKKQLQI